MGPFYIDENNDDDDDDDNNDNDDNNNNNNNTISYAILWNNIHSVIALSDISTVSLLLLSPQFKQSTYFRIM